MHTRARAPTHTCETKFNTTFLNKQREALKVSMEITRAT
jgi:hypothetical protein